jgi:hypothetical protein
MKYLIEEFYRAIVDGAPDPIPYSEILRTAKIMDIIFSQLEEPASAIGGQKLVLRAPN